MSYNISDIELKNIQKEMEGKDIIIIDESSFIGIKSLCILDSVLQKIACNDKAFGNFKVVQTGDFQQLSSVKDQDIQKPQSSDEIQKIIDEAEEDANK